MARFWSFLLGWVGVAATRRRAGSVGVGCDWGGLRGILPVGGLQMASVGEPVFGEVA